MSILACRSGNRAFSARAERRPRRIAWVLLLGLVVVAGMGCTRAHYRRRADQEVYGLVDRGSTDPRWPLDNFTIEADPRSRFFDPNSPDCPPMPPDDPSSHQLMRCVDGKPVWPYEEHYGRTPYVENPIWKACLEAYLPQDEAGAIVLDREAAVQVSLLHSREYQRELEDLYLSALDVSLQRFRFDTQFFGGNSTFFTSDGRVRGGGDDKSTFNIDTDSSARHLFATGADVVVNMANQLVWQFAGPDDYRGFTLLDFSLVQPLLRAGGRAVVLEGLTDSERALLANIRQMERFRRGFYAQIVTGRNPGPGPARGGVGFGGVSSGAPGGPGGFLGLQEEQLRIRNQEANVDALGRNLDRMEAFYTGGRAKRFQVDQIRQQFYDAYGTLLNIQAGYGTRLDTYKVTLGLPPDLNIKIQNAIEDPQLARFELIDPKMQATENEIHDLWLRLIQPGAAAEADQGESHGSVTLEEIQSQLPGIRDQCLVRMEELRVDRAALESVVATRRANLRRLFPPGGPPPTGVQGQTFDLSPSLGEDALVERVRTIDNDYYARAAAFLPLVLLLAEESQTLSAADWDPATQQASEQLLKLSTLTELTAMLSGSRLTFPLDYDTDPNVVNPEKLHKNLNVLKLPMIELMIYSARRSKIALTMEMYEKRLEAVLPENWDNVMQAIETSLWETDPRMDVLRAFDRGEGILRPARTDLKTHPSAESFGAETYNRLEETRQDVGKLNKAIALLEKLIEDARELEATLGERTDLETRIDALKKLAEEISALTEGIVDQTDLQTAIDKAETVAKAPGQLQEAIEELRETASETLPWMRTILEFLNNLVQSFDNLDNLAGSLLELLKASPEHLASVGLSNEGIEGLRAVVDDLAAVPILLTHDPVADAEPTELMNQLMQALAFHFSTVPLLQARIRLERAMLEPIRVDPAEALAIAAEHRRDWMNARAALVDAWRQIEVTANDLESDLDVTFSGDLGTTEEHPFRFRSTNGRLRVGLEFDAPLTRLAERNSYREVLIRFQQARRDYYAIEDRIDQSLRQTFRTMDLNRQNFEVSRRAVGVAIDQVEESQLRLLTPPKPGQGSQFGDTLAQDLVRNLTNLLRAQNNFQGVWVDQEVQRLSLDLDLGTMGLDAQGMWVPSEHVSGETLESGPEADEPSPFVPEIIPLPAPQMPFDVELSPPTGEGEVQPVSAVRDIPAVHAPDPPTHFAAPHGAGS